MTKGWLARIWLTLGAEYDPTNALMVGGTFSSPGMMAPQPFSPDRVQGTGRGGQKRRPRAPFSADGPVNDKTKSTIVIESIPEENFTEEQVRGFFSQFGNILEVSMQPYKRLAVVKYDNWASANAAYKSPKVIFENRFVKVFWFKDGESLLPPPVTSNGTTGSVTGSGEVGSGDTLIPAEMEEFVLKQEEAQKAHEEKMKKIQDLERQQQEIEKKQQELREEKAVLEAKLAKKTGGAHNGANGTGANPSKPTTQSEALRAKLAELEAEAKQLGINPDEAEDPFTWDSPSGFGRGRGRGLYRARGFALRGFRGGFRGRGGHHAAYAQYSLDNRPKRVKLVGVDFTESEKDENLRQFLFVSWPRLREDPEQDY